MTKINVQAGLPEMHDQDLPDDITSICAKVLNQYILEDGLVQNDPEEHRLERIMRFSEQYFRRYLRVVELQQTQGRGAIIAWQTAQNENFLRHAEIYQSLYKPVAHMAEKPYFMTNWSICFLVDTGLNVCGVESQDAFLSLSSEQTEMLEYVIRFGENLLQEFHATFMSGRA
jgi:hypothetical protein